MRNRAPLLLTSAARCAHSRLLSSRSDGIASLHFRSCMAATMQPSVLLAVRVCKVLRFEVAGHHVEQRERANASIVHLHPGAFSHATMA